MQTARNPYLRPKRIIWPAVIATALSCFAGVRPASALTMAAIEARMKSLKSELTDIYSRLESAGARLDEANTRIYQHTAALRTAERRRFVLRGAIDTRAVQMYMYGFDTTQAPAGDAATAADRMAYLDIVGHGERAIIEDIRALQSHADYENAALARAQVRARLARDDLAARKHEISSRLDELAQLDGFLRALLPRTDSRASRGGGRHLWCPVAGPHVVYNDFGFPRPGGPHTGNDISAREGQPERAILPGTIVDTPNGGWIGIGVVLRDPIGNEWLYAHQSARFVHVGQHVTGGEIVGQVGCTGHCYGPHLHFEYHPGGGAPVDPYRILSSAC